MIAYECRTISIFPISKVYFASSYFFSGKRSCLGESLARQEIFLFITGLLQNFEILPPEGQDFLNCTEIPGLAVAPSPYKVRFIPRRKLAPMPNGDS